MQSRNRLLIFLSVTLVCCSGLYGQDEGNWIDRNWLQLEGLIMPIKPFEAGEFPLSVRWMVSIRITGPLIDPITLTLRKYYSGMIEATALRPVGALSNQIREITKINPQAGVTEVANSIKLLSSTFSNDKCPALAKLSREFEHLSVSAVLPDELIMDSTQYEFLSQSLYGNRIQILYRGPGPEAASQDQPIVNWVERFRKLADRNCK